MGDQGTTGGAREERLRRMAERQGLRLERSQGRDVGSPNYQLVHPYTRGVVYGGRPGDALGLDDIEEYLARRDPSGLRTR